MDDPPEWQAAIEAHEQATQSDGDDDDRFNVWPENKQTLAVFLSLENCWEINSWTGQRLGIKRGAIESTLRMMHVPKYRHPSILKEIGIMQNAALEVFNRDHKSH